MSDDFFSESTEQSRIKAVIVAKYFWAWSRIMLTHCRQKGGCLAYIDLFAGPGRYEDGTESTPLLVLRRAIGDEGLRTKLVTVFNDADPRHVQSLAHAIAELPGVERLQHPPQLWTIKVGADLARELRTVTIGPTLLFVDPFGYKGLTLDLLATGLKDWGCDGVFFFNYNRVNAAIDNPVLEAHMAGIFGRPGLETLRQQCRGLRPYERELAVVERLAFGLQARGMTYVLPFRFRNEAGTRTSHHLVFVSKHPLGYGIMKDIMAKEGSAGVAGVPSLEYNPADRRFPVLFEYSRSPDELPGALLAAFGGQRLTVRQVYEQHNVGTPFLKKHYKSALLALEADRRVRCGPPAQARPRREGRPTMADGVRVTFPPKETPDG